MSTSPTRLERDPLGTVEVPADALWGVHTLRATRNSGTAEGVVTLPDRPALLRALVQVKIAAARANVEAGALAPEIGEAIATAGREVLQGRWHDQFPANLVQGGGGTGTNMNVNEVLANRAGELLGGARGAYDRVHPNDHVNRSQSTNDVYPTALQLATIASGSEALVDFEHLAATFDERAAAHAGMERLGRTCMQDALPLTVETTHRTHATALRRTASGFGRALDGLRAVPLGGTAIGSGAGTPPGYSDRVVALLAEETGIDLTPAPDRHDALANLDPVLSVAGALERVMLSMAQVAQDLRFLSSGPRGGIGEVALPPVQMGSSMMPGKINPVLPELVLQTSFEVRAARHVVECATAAGELELNVMEPVVAKHLLAAIADSGRTLRLFADACVAGLEWIPATTEAHLRGSLLDAVTSAAKSGWESTHPVGGRE